MREGLEESRGSAPDATTANNVFYNQQLQRQRQNAWPQLLELPGFERLRDFMLEAFVQYFDALGSRVRPTMKDVDWWFSVHIDGEMAGLSPRHQHPTPDTRGARLTRSKNRHATCTPGGMIDHAVAAG